MTARDATIAAICAQPPQLLYDTVSEVAAAYCEQHFSALRAALMIGSMGRGEATWERTVEGWRVLGDAEFVLVFPDDKVPGTGTAERFCSSVGSLLKARGIECAVDVSVVGSRWLSRLPKTIFTYEIRNASRVVYGSTSVLNSIPGFAALEINAEDAWRLLCNRLVEWLEVPERSDRKRYRSVKLVLDTATALLVYRGAYVHTYAGRNAALQELAANDAATVWPFPKAEFVTLVSECTNFKLGSGAVPRDAVLADAPKYAIALADLLRRNRTRGLASRVRGWAVVARQSGLSNTARDCARWMRLFTKDTPRNLVYSAALRVVQMQIAALSDQARLQSIRATLPVTGVATPNDMETLSREIAQNYHKFVERTRA